MLLAVAFSAVGMLCAAPVGHDPVDDIASAELARQKVPGMTLAIVRNGKPVKVAAYGLANVEHAVPARRETVYQSGSVGKQFTAAAVMLLANDGKIDLDASIRRYLPDAPLLWQPVTVRHLLTHMSGLADWDELTHSIERDDHTEDQLLAKLFTRSLAFTPGERFDYSNTGYVLLGILVSRVSGEFYGDLLRERIFVPLGMSTRIISEADIVPHRAAGYRFVNGALKNQEWVSPSANSTADGSLYLTVDDLIRWDAALYTDHPLPKAARERMWTPATTSDGKPTGYGFGWTVDEVDGHRRVGHPGEWQGFSAVIDRYVDDRLTVIVLMNAERSDDPAVPGANPSAIADRIAAHYLATQDARESGQSASGADARDSDVQ